jgi:Flp pilus assembly protein TadG
MMTQRPRHSARLVGAAVAAPRGAARDRRALDGLRVGVAGNAARLIPALLSRSPAALGAARDRRGLAWIELALVAPVLLLLMVAAVDYGRAISQSIDVNNALRAGAQQAIATPDNATAITNAISTALPSGVANPVVSVTCYCGALAATSEALPAVAACTATCPASHARAMRLDAQTDFTSYNIAAGTQFTSRFSINRIAGNVTVRVR